METIKKLRYEADLKNFTNQLTATSIRNGPDSQASDELALFQHYPFANFKEKWHQAFSVAFMGLKEGLTADKLREATKIMPRKGAKLQQFIRFIKSKGITISQAQDYLSAVGFTHKLEDEVLTSAPDNEDKPKISKAQKKGAREKRKQKDGLVKQKLEVKSEKKLRRQGKVKDDSKPDVQKPTTEIPLKELKLPKEINKVVDPFYGEVPARFKATERLVGLLTKTFSKDEETRYLDYCEHVAKQFGGGERNSLTFFDKKNLEFVVTVLISFLRDPLRLYKALNGTPWKMAKKLKISQKIDFKFRYMREILQVGSPFQEAAHYIFRTLSKISSLVLYFNMTTDWEKSNTENPEFFLRTTVDEIPLLPAATMVRAFKIHFWVVGYGDVTSKYSVAHKDYITTIASAKSRVMLQYFNDNSSKLLQLLTDVFSGKRSNSIKHERSRAVPIDRLPEKRKKQRPLLDRLVWDVVKSNEGYSVFIRFQGFDPTSTFVVSLPGVFRKGELQKNRIITEAKAILKSEAFDDFYASFIKQAKELFAKYRKIWPTGLPMNVNKQQAFKTRASLRASTRKAEKQLNKKKTLK